MVQLVNHSQEAIQALHERIWEVVRRVMESAGKSTADGLGIALHLVDMLPTIPLQLTFNTVTAGPLGHTPEALTYASQCSIDCGAMTVLGEELIREPPSAKDEAMQAVWRVMATDTGSIRIATVGGAGNDNVDHPSTSLSPAPRTCTSMDWHTTGYGTKRSPTYSPNCSPFQTHHSAGSRRSLILPNPVCRVLTAQSPLSQRLTLSHHWVTPMVKSDPTPVPLMLFSSETLMMTVQKRRRSP